MTRLSDTKLVILSAASQRENHLVLPLPRNLKGGAAHKVIQALIAKGLAAEADADLRRGDPVWRETGDGRAVSLVITEAGLAALDGGTAPAAADAEAPARKVRNTKKSAPAPRQARVRDRTSQTTGDPAAVRPGTKQARLIALLKRPKGATIAEIAEALGWQAHTVRGAIAGALKKKLGLTIISETDDRRGRVYRLG